MRQAVSKRLHELMSEDADIVLLVGDLGYKLFDKILDDFPDRFYNVGAAETALLDIGVGLALAGKKPICYSITPFLLYRPFETIRTYINHETIPVILIGSGREGDYEIDGFSHFAGDDYSFMQNFKNIVSYWPPTDDEAIKSFNEAIEDTRPYYINLTR